MTKGLYLPGLAVSGGLFILLALAGCGPQPGDSSTSFQSNDWDLQDVTATSSSPGGVDESGVIRFVGTWNSDAKLRERTSFSNVWGNLDQCSRFSPALHNGAGGTVGLTYVNCDRTVRYRRSSDAAWVNLGGELHSPVTTVVDAEGTLHAFGIGSDQAVYHNNTSGWESRGGVAASPVSAIASPQGDIDIFVVGTDQAVYRQHFDRYLGWGSWQYLGGTVHNAFRRVAVGRGPNGKMYVFVTGTNNAVYYRRREQVEPEVWSEWRTLDGIAQSSIVFGNDDYNDAAHNAQIFVISRDGTIYRRKLYNEALDAWSWWENIPVSATSIATGRGANNSLILFVRNPSNGLEWRNLSLTNSDWNLWDGDLMEF